MQPSLEEEHMTDVFDPTATHLPLPGTTNVRDLGGFPVRDGAIGAGRLFRAEAITQADAGRHVQHWNAEWEPAYRVLGIRQIIDLRNADEVETAPSAWAVATGARLTPASLNSGGQAMEERLIRGLLSGKVAGFGVSDMAGFLTSLIDRRPREIGAVVRAIGDGGAPVLIHCTAGKDRTGAVVGVLLAALGAADEDIVADYALTERLRPDGAEPFAEQFAAAGVPLDGMRVLAGSPPEAMRAALAHLRENHGGAQAYLRGPGAVTQDELARLRDTLVVQ
jgi:protein-tyrosine phosphatase